MYTFIRRWQRATLAGFFFILVFPFAPVLGNGDEPAVLSAVAGQWRGVIQFPSGTEVPFRFEIVKNTSGQSVLYFLNASEQFEAGRATVQGDSIRVAVDQFDNEFVVQLRGDSLSGYFRKQDHTGLALPVRAKKGDAFRFAETNAKPGFELTGRYDVVLESPGGGTDEKAVLVLEQRGKRLTGSLLRITGDARYLDGIIEGNQFSLSVFFGSGASLYKGEVGAERSLRGAVIGARGQQLFTAVKNDQAVLPDLYTLTTLKKASPAFSFSFPNQFGKTVSLQDPAYKGKAVIIAIGGTWCPNCVDEAAFLSPWYKENKKRGIEVISLQFERQTDTAYVNKVFNRFRNRFDIRYELLIAGLADKQKVLEHLPAFENFLAFPTTIFINREGKVDKIHTGYTGPATGSFYAEFVKEFNDEVDQLLKK
jgi:peroxiredoxin